MQVNVKYNVGDRIKYSCDRVAYHIEQDLMIERIIIERGNPLSGWKPYIHYECKDLEDGNFVTLDDEEIDKCSSIKQ